MLVAILAASTSLAQNTTPAPDTKTKADVIFVHGNVYTGVPANTPFASIERAEAIAVKGDRILAIGKAFDLERFKGPQTQVVVLPGEPHVGGRAPAP